LDDFEELISDSQNLSRFFAAFARTAFTGESEQSMLHFWCVRFHEHFLGQFHFF
jgi:hypothetical protein